MKNYYELISHRLFSIYIVYTLLFSVIAYSTTIVYTGNDYKRTEQKRISQLTDTLEADLSTSVDFANILSRHESIVKYAQINGSMDYTVSKKACDEMYGAFLLNDVYSYAAVINYPSKHVIIQNGTLSYSYFKSAFSLEDTQIDEQLESFYSLNKSRSVVFTTKNVGSALYGGPFIVCLVSCPTQEGKPVLYAFFYDLEKMFQNIPKNSINAKAELLFQKNNTYILYNEQTPSKIEFEELNNLSGYKKIAFSKSESNYWGTIVGTLYVPRIRYLLHINSFFLLMLMLLIVISFAGYIFVRTNANKMYSPIKNLTKILPSDYLEESDGDLGAFEDYVSSLITQKNVMSTIISEAKIALEDKFLIQLMTNTLSKAQIKDGIVSYNLADIPFPAICFIARYRNYEELKNILSLDGLNEVRVSIHEILSEGFKSKEYFKLVDIDAQTIAAISTIRPGEDFAMLLKKAALNIEMMLDIDMVMFMGTAAASWYEVPDSYNCAYSSKNKYLLTSDQNVVFTPGSENNQSVKYSSETENELISAVTDANTSKALECVNKIVDMNMKNSTLTQEHFQQLVVMLYSTIIKLLTAINKTETKLFDDVKIYLELMSCPDAEAMKTKLGYFITTIIASIANTQQNITDSAANRMIQYARNHYSEDISLFTLADYLNVSQSYASKIFKQQTGENFKDYLTNVRLTKAVELMRENPYSKIADIAKNVGYTSFTLTRVFTKKYGKSPSDYIRELQNHNG